MYEKYTHTERTVIERGDVAPVTTQGVVCVLWAFLCLLLVFIFAVTDGLVVALGIAACGFVGLVLLILIGCIPNAEETNAVKMSLSQPIDSTSVVVRKKENLAVKNG